MIPEYAESIARKLAFDPRLARSVRAEVEDHLWECVAADPAGEGAVAERRAIASFGDARALAAQLAAVALARQARGLALAVMAVVAAAFVAMKVRVAWYALVAHAPKGGWSAPTAFVLSIDRYSFWLAAAMALAAWAYFVRGRMPDALAPTYPQRLRRFFVLCAVAMASLVVCIACDAILTAFQAIGRGFGPDSVLPFASMALEAAGAIVVAAQLCLIARRAVRAAHTFRAA